MKKFPIVSITGVGRSGATVITVLNGDVVSRIIITNVGTGYTRIPSVAFSGGTGTSATGTAVLGTNATVIVVLSPTSIVSLTIGTGGTGYTSSPTGVFTGGGGTGDTVTGILAGTTTANLTVSAGGSGYTSVPTIVLTLFGQNFRFFEGGVITLFHCSLPRVRFASYHHTRETLKRVCLCTLLSPQLSTGLSRKTQVFNFRFLRYYSVVKQVVIGV